MSSCKLLFLLILGSSLTLGVKTLDLEMKELSVKYPDRLLLLEDQSSLIVGARDKLLVVNPETLESLQEKEVNASQTARKECYNQILSKEECLNYIRVLLVKDNDTLLVCGTSAFHPHCDVRHLSNLSVISTEKVPNDDFSVYQRDNRYFSVCPFDPDEGNVAMIMGGQYYAATQADDRNQRNVFYKVNFDGTDLAETDIGNPNWIETLDFYPLKMFEYGDSIFLIYREVPTEADYEKIFTRIAKVCKGDNGTKEDTLVQRWLWKTFVKGTLKCTVKTGSLRYDFDYNEMVSVSDLFDFDGKPHFVGVFRSVHNGPAGSAVCVFGMEEILAMYDKQYRYHDANQWKVSSNEKAIDCQDMRLAPTNYLLIANPLRQKGTLPLIFESYANKSQELGQVVVVPSVKAVNGSDCFVMLIGTGNGDIVRSWSCGEHAEVFDKQQYFTTDGGVKKLMLNIPSGQRERAALYMTANDRLAKISVFTCHYNQTSVCVSDPLCAWNIIDQRCVIRPQDYTFKSNATLRYPNITVNASYTPDRLPTLAPSTATTQQPTTLGTPTATETDKIIITQATDCVRVNPQPLSPSDDETCVTVPVIAGISVSVCGVGLLLGVLIGYCCGRKVRVHRGQFSRAMSPVHIESQPELKSRKEIVSVSFNNAKPTTAYNITDAGGNHSSIGKKVIYESANGDVNSSEYEASPKCPSELKNHLAPADAVGRSESVQSAASTNELLTNERSNKYPRSGGMK